MVVFIPQFQNLIAQPNSVEMPLRHTHLRCASPTEESDPNWNFPNPSPHISTVWDNHTICIQKRWASGLSTDFILYVFTSRVSGGWFGSSDLPYQLNQHQRGAFPRSVAWCWDGRGVHCRTEEAHSLKEMSTRFEVHINQHQAHNSDCQAIQDELQSQRSAWMHT